MQTLRKNSHLKQLIFSQLTHTAITVAIVAALFFGAARVGALDSVLAPATATAGSSFTTVNYQGRLGDAAGNPVDTTGAPDGLSMTFALYDSDTGGTALWSETHANVPVAEGLFSVKLGSVNALNTGLLNGDRWLGIQVGNDPEMAPREKLAAVPYAMVAGTALSVSSLDAPDGSPEDALIVDESGNVGIRASDPSADFQVRRFKAGTHASGDNYWLTAYSGYGAGWDGSNWRVEGDNHHNAGALIAASITNGVLRFFTFPNTDVSDQTIADDELYSYMRVTISNGGMSINGNLTASGTKSAVVETERYGERKLYAFEQPTNRFGDEGWGELVAGTARVTLDPVFLETVEDDFLIHLTPYGHATLYVAEVGEDYFVVQAQEADAAVPFAWLLTATRKGYADVRLELAGE